MEMNYGERELRQIEQELQVEILPGTEVMTDVGGQHFVKTSGKSQQVLVPQPSADPHDPLNWSLRWKVSAIIAASFTTFTQGYGPLSLAPLFGDLIAAFDCTLAEAVQFTGVSILVLGFSNFVWVPISTSFGRRPVIIVSQIICLGSSIWRARAPTYNSFMGACILNGIGAGPAETAQPAVIADIFFLHDRGKWNTLYWVVYMGSLMVGPIISGVMAAHVGWRSFWWLNTALLAMSLLMNITMFPETKWHRKHPGEWGTPQDSGSGDEKAQVQTSEGSDRQVEEVETALHTDAQKLAHAETADQDPWLGRGYPSKIQWGLYTPNPTPIKSILLDLWVPWKLHAFPIVEFAAFVTSWSCSCFLTLNLTQSQAFAAPPYNWDSQSIGFTNFAVLAGGLIGLSTAGPLSDWVSAYLTKRNRGIREPEMRLVAMIPYVIIMYLGNIIVSVGYENHWPWQAIVVIGYACAGIQVAALPSMSTTYAVDSYKPVTGSLFVAVTVNKNVWGYGFSKFITNWIDSSGYIPPIMTNGSLCLLWCLFGILFYFKGKTFRRWTKDSSVHRM
ncbi:serine/threonine kinase 16 [Xylariaceae sp. FL0255]|nr:serine/threonine kinase 16 [Xylariaceae sp. FL0255]